MSALGICKMKYCFIYLMFSIRLYIFHVFYGEPIGRIAERLIVFTL